MSSFDHKRRMLALHGLSLTAAATFGSAIRASSTVRLANIKGQPEQVIGAALLRAIYKRAGRTVEFKEYDGRRALQASLSGKVDGETLRGGTLGQRTQSLQRMPVSVMTQEMHAFVLVDGDVRLTSRADLVRFHCAISARSPVARMITRDLPTVTRIADTPTLFEVLRSGNCDIALASRLDGMVWVQRPGLTEVQELKTPFWTEPLYHYLHVSRQDIMAQITGIARAMHNSGELAALRSELEQDLLLRTNPHVRG